MVSQALKYIVDFLKFVANVSIRFFDDVNKWRLCCAVDTLEVFCYCFMFLEKSAYTAQTIVVSSDIIWSHYCVVLHVGSQERVSVYHTSATEMHFVAVNDEYSLAEEHS